MKLYISRPIVIEAVEWNGSVSHADEIEEWSGGKTKCRLSPEDLSMMISIETLEGTMEARPGYYIIKDTHGEFYPYRPDVFTTKYEEVKE